MQDQEPSVPNHDVTLLLQRWQDGDNQAMEDLLPLVYEELHRLSRHYLQKESRNHTLQPTALVNEAYMRLAGKDRVEWKSRAHFIGYAAHVMRGILINYWHSKQADKRGGGAYAITLDHAVDSIKEQNLDLVVLNEALDKLGERDARKAKVVEMKFFGGMTEEEIGEVLDISAVTVRREWKSARAWLLKFLRPEEGQN